MGSEGSGSLSGSGARFPLSQAHQQASDFTAPRHKFHIKILKTSPLQSSGVSRPELGSGWCNHQASAGDQDPNRPERRSRVSYGLFPNSTSN